MAAQASQAPLAGNEPDGRCASGPSVQSAKTCSAFWFLGEPEPLSLALSGSPVGMLALMAGRLFARG